MPKQKQADKAYKLMNTHKPIRVPHHVMCLFSSNAKELETFGNQASLGEDFGTLAEFRSALDWLVGQFGGKVTWDEKK